MSHTVLALCRPEVAPGFGLAGLTVHEASTPAEAAAELGELRAKPEIGVILIEDTLYRGLPEDLQRDIGRRPLPMLVPFPAPAWKTEAESAEAYIVELLRQVVGYRVRLR
ncbi:MAG TPA: V-type ATP synthase subunit F [Gemmatimonadales bacterium]|nr:V-type ATP synthase subunit F [Gemmatimonadales bacterium]